MNRELSMEFVRVTEAAAMASARGVGRGDKNGIDQLAVDAMRKMFDTVNISGTVVIGEGEMDEAPMLYIGEKVGAGGPEVDIAVDPVEGTNLVAKGQLRTGSRQKAHRSGKGQHSGQRLTAADRLGFSGAVPTDEHCGQHHRAQCRIAPPHRADRTQPGHGIGAKGKICPAGDAQRSGQENRKQNQ